uniref:flagellar hook-length control protein FliK n=1 Tax=Stappia sp. TaxID=1870903 RepID=UPI003BADB59C
MSVSRISTPTGVVPVTPVTRLPPLAVGDLIAVRVARHMGEGVMRLVSGGGGGFQLDVEGQEMLPVGSRAFLSVEGKPGEQRLSVRADTSVPPQAATSPAAARMADLATRLAADQDGLAPLYAGLSALVQSLGGGQRALPPGLAQAISTLFGMQLPAGSLEGKTLREAVRNVSGGRLGSVLADLAASLEGAAGGREAQPRQATPPPLPGLARHLGGEGAEKASPALTAALAAHDGKEVAALLLAKTLAALARTRFAGLASRGLVGDPPGEGARGADQVILLPLAVSPGVMVLELRIGRDDTPGHEGEGAHPAFRLRFGLDSPDGGAVEGLAGLDGRRFFAHLSVERDETRLRLARELGEIRTGLSALGLEVADLRVAAMAADPPDPGHEAASSGQLVDRVS